MIMVCVRHVRVVRSQRDFGFFFYLVPLSPTLALSWVLADVIVIDPFLKYFNSNKLFYIKAGTLLELNIITTCLTADELIYMRARRRAWSRWFARSFAGISLSKELNVGS